MAEPTRWTQPKSSVARPVPELRRTPDGLRVVVNSAIPADLRIFPVTAPEPLPMVATTPLPTDIVGYGGALSVTLARAGDQALVPVYGVSGALVDLEYADGLGLSVDSDSVAVWLSADAPSDVVNRLRKAGLEVTSDRTDVAQREVLASQAPGIALRFLLMAVFIAVGLAMGAIVVTAALERGHSPDGLAALREQGVAMGILRTVAVLRRCALVILAAGLGMTASAVSWWLARDVLPTYVDADATVAVPPPVTPTVTGVALPLAGAVVVLLLTCWLAAWVAGGDSEGTDA
jgi:hypothetical protein